MNKIFCILFCILLFNQAVQSQSQEEEIEKSIREILQNPELSVDEKVQQASQLVLTIHNINPYYPNSLELAKEIASYVPKTSDEKSGVYAYITRIWVEVDVDVALQMKDSCLWFIERCDDAEVKAYGYLALGKLKYKSVEGLNYLFKAIEAIENLELWEDKRDIYQSISAYYIAVGDVKNAIKYAEKEYEAALKTNEAFIICEALNDLGVVYSHSEYEDMQNKAIELYEKAIRLFMENKEQGNPDFEDSFVYSTLLIHSSDYYIKKDNYAKAEANVNEALIYALETDHIHTLVECYARLSDIAEKQNELSKAEMYLLKIVELESRDEYIALDIYYSTYQTQLSLAGVYYKMGDYKKSAQHYKDGMSEYMKVHNSDLAVNAVELEAAYEAERKAQELKFLHEQVDAEKKRNYLLIALVGALLVGSFLVFRLFRSRITVAKQKQLILLKENSLLQTENEKSELEARLHAEEAKVLKLESERMQKEVVASGLLVEHKNNVMQQLKELFIQNPALRSYRMQLESILLQESRVDSSFDDYKTGLQDFNPQFYKQLQQKANDKLTPLDLKYCACIYMKMSSKEMADVFNVEPRTIRVNKYRLKQKLNLSKDDDLSLYIQGLI